MNALGQLVELVRSVADVAEAASPVHRPRYDYRHNGHYAKIPTLFDQPPAQPAPTSRKAASQIAPKAPKLRERVYAYLRDQGPATDEQIALALKLNPSTARPRRIELAKAGLIRPCLTLGITASGRSAVRWEVKP